MTETIENEFGLPDKLIEKVSIEGFVKKENREMGKK